MVKPIVNLQGFAPKFEKRDVKTKGEVRPKFRLKHAIIYKKGYL